MLMIYVRKYVDKFMFSIFIKSNYSQRKFVASDIRSDLTAILFAGKGVVLIK
jgi:hypothetical protein